MRTPLLHTQGHRRAVQRLVAEGYTAPEVAAEVGVSVRALEDALRRWRIRMRPGRPPDATARADVVGCVAAGMTAPQIARLRGRRPHTVWAMLVKLERAGIVRRAGRTGRGVVWEPDRKWRRRDGA